MTTTNADRTVAVFAATGAIGRASAHELARQGAHVWVSGRDEARTRAVADEIAQEGGKATARTVDATDAGSVDAHLDEVLATDGQLHAVFNAIGDRPQAYGYPAASSDQPLADFMRPIEQVVGSQFLTSRAGAARMGERGGGSVVLLSATLTGMAAAFMAGISAACGAVEATARALAGEFGPAGVRVNTARASAMPETRTILETGAGIARLAGLDPSEGGPTPTPLGRPVTLDDTARTIAFLASPASDGITAQVLTVCAGQFPS